MQIMNWDRCERNWSSLIRRYYPEICLEVQRTPAQSQVSLIHAKIHIQAFFEYEVGVLQVPKLNIS
jgi:hypothetical protein